MQTLERPPRPSAPTANPPSTVRTAELMRSAVLVVLGTLISGVGAAFGVAASIITGIGTVLGVLEVGGGRAAAVGKQPGDLVRQRIFTRVQR